MRGLHLEHYQRLDVAQLDVLSAGNTQGSSLYFEDGAEAIPVKTTREFGQPNTTEQRWLHRIGYEVLNGIARDYAADSHELFEQYQQDKEQNAYIWRGDTEQSLAWHRQALYRNLSPNLQAYARGLNRMLTNFPEFRLYIAAALDSEALDTYTAIDLASIGTRALVAARLEGFAVTDERGEAPLHIEPVVTTNLPEWTSGFLPKGSQLLKRPLYWRSEA